MNVSVPLAERGDVQAWQGGDVNGMARPFQVSTASETKEMPHVFFTVKS